MKSKKSVSLRQPACGVQAVGARRSFTMMEKKAVLSKTGGVCAHCGCHLDVGSMTIDHVFPLDKGGIDDEYNLLPLCDDCNQRKSNYVYPFSDFYVNINSDEYLKFEMYYNYATFDYTRNTIIGYDIMYFYILPERFKNMVKNMKARHAPKKKIDEYMDKLMVPIPMTKAYAGEAKEIFEFVKKIDNKGYLGADIYRSHYDIVHDIDHGIVYTLGTKNGICGVFIFKDVEKLGTVLPYAVYREAEKIGIVPKYIMTYAAVDMYAYDCFNMIMNYLVSSQLYNGWMPLYSGLIDKMYVMRDKCVIMPFQINGCDTTLEFMPIEHMIVQRRNRAAGLMASQGYYNATMEDLDFFGKASIRYVRQSDYIGDEDMAAFLEKYPRCALFFKPDDYELYGRGFVSLGKDGSMS